MAAIIADGRLTLTGDVGDMGYGDYFTHADVVVALAQVEDSDDLTVVINSGGGDASDGAAIHALLSRRVGSTDVVIDGIAASAASLIAMAGDTVTMSAGSILMIHDPSGMTFGTSEDHTKTVEALEALATSYSRVYAAKSGKSADETRAIMKAERWFTPEEAVAEGFADKAADTASKPVAAFDYRIYAHAPQRLCALASKKNWRRPDAKEVAPSALARQLQEHSMSDDKKGGDLTAELDRLRAENATLKASKGAESNEAIQQELAQLRAEKEARANEDAIMALEEAKGNEAQAKALACAGVKVDAAKAILAAAPKAAESEYENRRLNGEGLNGGSARPAAKGDRSILAAAVDRANKRR